jgi:hypothetical protein
MSPKEQNHATKVGLLRDFTKNKQLITGKAIKISFPYNEETYAKKKYINVWTYAEAI